MVLCMLEKSDQYGRWRSRVKSCGSATHLPYFQPVSLPPSACCCSDWSLVIVALASLYDEEGPVELAELQRCLLCFRRRRRLREDQSKEAEARSKEGGRDQGKFNLHHQVEKSRLGRGEFEFERGRESRRVVVLERSILLSEFSNRFVPFTFSSVLSIFYTPLLPSPGSHDQKLKLHGTDLTQVVFQMNIAQKKFSDRSSSFIVK